MLTRAVVVWVLGWLTVVPGATYHLFFHAPREQYAFLITLVLFWIFGYWGVVGPLVMALKVRKVLRALEQAHSKGDLRRALQNEETRQVAIDLIASEHRIPRFLATRVWRRLAQASGLSVSPGPSPGRS